MADTREYATAGNRRDESLLVVSCRTCHNPMVWCTSRRTGKRYPACVSSRADGGLYYRADRVHNQDVCAGFLADHAKWLAAEAAKEAANAAVQAEIAWLKEFFTWHPTTTAAEAAARYQTHLELVALGAADIPLDNPLEVIA